MKQPHWKKLGVLYCPPAQGQHPSLLSHAANPLPVHIKDDVYRVFYSGRDAQNRSSVGAVDIDIIKRQIIKAHHQPFFTHGPQGSFYAEGVSIGNCYEADGVTYMLFMGWQNPKDIHSIGGHWRGEVGRLIVHPDLTLTLDGNKPFMPLNADDPLSLSYPWVMKQGDGRFHMWYGTTKSWDAGNGEMVHVINAASSVDGHVWQRSGLAIPYQLGVAQAFSRPTVLYSASCGYEMWFSYRCGSGKTYRIGYAKSRDGLAWQLALEETGIDVSSNGWDSEMIEYPFVLEHKGQRYMLYNGNGYGKTGFGLAVFENE